MRILLILLGVIYLISPYDLFPDFFVGWGWLDDLVILWLLWRYLFKGQAAPRTPYGPGSDRSDERFGRQQSGSTGSAAAQPSGPADPFAVLGLRPGASAEDIKAAYRHLVNRYHPDKLQHLGEEFRELAEEKFKTIQSAYQSLKDAGQV
jgi:DnaJ like chaperone protein